MFEKNNLKKYGRGFSMSLVTRSPQANLAELTSTKHYEIKNRDSWCLTTKKHRETEKGSISVELSDRWGLPNRGAVLFVWPDCRETPTLSMLHKTVKKLSQQNSGSGFQVYKQPNNILCVVFGKGGLAGGGKYDRKSDKPTKFDTVCSIIVTGTVASAVIAYTSPVRPKIAASLVSGGLLHGAHYLYLCATQDQEFSPIDLGLSSLQGAGDGLVRQLTSAACHGCLESKLQPLSNLKRGAIHATVAVMGYITHKIFRWQIPSRENTAAAAFSGAGAFATASLADTFLPIPDTMRQYIIHEAVKGGSSAALVKAIWNLFTCTDKGEAKKWYEGLFSATLFGAATGAVGAVVEGRLPKDLKTRKELEAEEKKVADLAKKYEEKDELVRSARREYYAATDQNNLIKIELEAAKAKALQAHNDFVSTGVGKAFWEQLQKQVAAVQKKYQEGWNVISRLDTKRTAAEGVRDSIITSSDLEVRRTAVENLRDEYLNQERIPRMFLDLQASIPSSLEPFTSSEW